MRARVLPASEYARLERTGMPLFPGVRPEDVDVVVVEDGEKVVACMTVLRATHFEGAWIDPEHRNAGVTRALLGLATALAECRGSQWVFAGAENGDERMRGILARLGGTRAPMDTYVLPLRG